MSGTAVYRFYLLRRRGLRRVGGGGEEAKYTCAVNMGQVPRSLGASRLFFNRP